MMAQQYPPGYGQPSYGQPPQPQYAQPRPEYQQQPQQYAARGDRLPPMPGMLQRPAPAQPQREPVVRGAAPELTQDSRSRNQDVVSSPGWKPIHIPSPADLGIGKNDSTPVLAQPIMPPASYDLGTVMTWLDGQGVRNCQRTRLAEGYQFTCQIEGSSAPITTRAIQEAEALKQLVQQVTLQKQGQHLAQR